MAHSYCDLELLDFVCFRFEGSVPIMNSPNPTPSSSSSSSSNPKLPPTSAKAQTDGDTRVFQGNSSNPGYTKRNLKVHAPDLHDALERLERLSCRESWGFFSCAEPNAIANLLARTAHPELPKILISRTTRIGESLPLCKNCQQWLEGSGFSGYRIKAEFLPKAAKEEYDPLKMNWPDLSSGQ